MTARIVLLSGPPAAGKDTVTAALRSIDQRFILFDKIKVGSGRSSGYRMLSAKRYSDLEVAGEILQSHERYGNRYAVDKPRLQELSRDDAIPVIHVGRRANLASLRADPVKWPTFSVLLWITREAALRRLLGRGSSDVSERLAAYDEEWRDLQAPGAAGDFDLVVYDDELPPLTIATRVIDGLEHPRNGQDITRTLAEIRHT